MSKTAKTTKQGPKQGDGLQWHENQQQFATDCGQYLSPKTGRPAWKRFYLGSAAEATAAQKLKEYIRGEWKLLKLRGATLWDEATLRRIAAMRAGVDPMALQLTAPAPATPMVETAGVSVAATGMRDSGKTLYRLIDEYEGVLKQRFQSKQISGDHFYGFRLRINSAKRFIADVSLSSLEYSHLFGFAQKLVARPISGRGTPLAIATVKNYRQGLTEVLTYAEDCGAWQPKFNWKRSLNMKTSAMTTDDERDEIRKVDIFNPDQLRMLWNNATERERLYMLLALNCGMGGKEISTLKLKWLHLDIPEPYIERPRNKTKVPGRWVLWPEVVILLRRHLAPNNVAANPNLYALLGFGGFPLVELREKNLVYKNSSKSDFAKRDEITHRFRTLRERIKERYNLETIPLPFYAFRRTGYSWIKQDGRYGTEVAEAYSQHKEKGMIVNYSNPIFSRVAEATNAMRDDLIPKILSERPNPIIHAKLDPIDTSDQ